MEITKSGEALRILGLAPKVGDTGVAPRVGEIAPLSPKYLHPWPLLSFRLSKDFMYVSKKTVSSRKFQHYCTVYIIKITNIIHLSGLRDHRKNTCSKCNLFAKDFVPK